jgi:hypothetical protein
VRELTLGEVERSLQVSNEASLLAGSSKDFLVKSLLVSNLGFRESGLLLFTFKENLFSLGRLLEVSIAELGINLCTKINICIFQKSNTIFLNLTLTEDKSTLVEVAMT